MLAWGRGGTDADAVGALYDRLAAGIGPGEGLLMAPTPAAFEASRARITRPLDGVEVVIATSGSSDGRGHLVGLSLDALTASADATHERLGGPGQWVTSLPLHGVAGFQVVWRSVLGGRRPVAYAGGGAFDAARFGEAVARLDGGVRHYLSLVPTQLRQAVERAGDLLARFDAVLVGGAALPAPLARRAADAGVRVVTTYGSTETAGGCVYDGVPLDGVEARLVGGLVHLAGPTLASGYLDSDDQPFVTLDGRRFLATHDRGAWADGRLQVLGRADDVLISGGANVDPHQVEDVLASLPGEWVVVGVPDAAWGQLVTAVATDPSATLDAARAATAALPAAGRPRALVRVGELPRRPTGKVDRRAAADAAVHALARGEAERRP